MKQLIGAVLLVASADVAQAQGFYGMQNDATLLQAINQMTMTLSNACQMGDPQSCQNYNYIMGNANAMMGASNACQSGDQMGCNYYAQYYNQMNNDYMVFNQQFGGGMMAQAPSGGINPLGATHDERMQAIQNFGANNTANWQSHMNQMDINHQNFMNSINN